jgi:general secretion pathway protein A
MDETRWDAGQRLFPATPDAARYYPATTHEQALAQLLHAVADSEGLAVLTGEPGTGKTLVCHCLLERLGAETASAMVTNSHLADRTALLQAILFDLSLPHESGSEQELRLRLTEFLLKSFAGGTKTVLLVDEAQNLNADLLEELRLLGNLEAGPKKALHVILVGQPGLLETLRLPELAALRQRLSVPCRLEPLGVDEAVDYLGHHLRRAGLRAEQLFTEESLALLVRHTGGLPRLLNHAAHQALLLANTADIDCVDAEVVLEALARLGIEVSDVEAPLGASEEAKLAAEEPAATTLAYEALRPSA